MNWRINESGVSATIENIEWERIHLILTVRLHIDGQKTYDIDKMEFYAVNNFGGCGSFVTKIAEKACGKT